MSICPYPYALTLIIFMWSTPVFADFKEVQEDFFKITVPEEFTITKTTPAGDFDIFIIKNSIRPYVGIYVGNQPNFPKNSNRSTPSESKTFQANDVKIISHWKQNTLLAKETLIQLPLISGPSWPMFIHAWISDLSSDEVLLADKILMSLEVRPKKIKTR